MPDFLLSQRLYGIRADKKVCSGLYLYHWLQSDVGKRDLHNRATGTTVVGIRQSELRKVKVLCASKILIDTFTEQNESIFSKLAINEKQNKTLTKLRDTLLPKLLSGELRIPDAEKLIKEVYPLT